VKCSGKMFIVMLVTALSGSVGFGAVLDSGGVIGLVHCEESFIDTDIDILHRGVVEDVKPANVLPVIKVTVANSTIDTTTADKYSPQIGISVFTVDISDTPQATMIPLSGPTDLQYAKNTGQTLAAKFNKYTRLSPVSPFDFKIGLNGG
jgi:hypothetical protein